MNDLASLLEFVVDVVCMMPPLQEVAAAGVSKEMSIAVCFGAVAVFGFSLIARTTAEMFHHNRFVAILAAICVAALAFGFIERPLWEAIFMVGYPAMVMALRFGEGALVGSRLSSLLRPWHVIVFLAFVCGLYFALKPLPEPTLSIVKGAWAAFGAVLASVTWTQMLRTNNRVAFGSPLATAAIFLVFLSTLLYVSASSLDRIMYQCAFPAGIVAGILSRRTQV